MDTMSGTKHTAGPWQRQGLRITTEGALGHIALMGESPTSLADACLIAAAPELLDALKAIKSRGICEVTKLLCDQAIAKAEGKL